MIALGGVVVDHVENHLDPGRVQGLDHALELGELLAPRPGRRIQRVGCEEADRGVAPVVGEPALDQVALVGDVMDRQQLDGGDAQRRQVLDRRIGGEACVGAAQILPHERVQLREALDVKFVDDRLRPRSIGRSVAFPVEGLVDDDSLRNRLGVVLVVGGEVGIVVRVRHVRERVGSLVVDRALDRLGVGVDQKLGRVEAMAAFRVVRPVDAVGVPLARPDVRQVAMPVEGGPLGQRESRLDVVGVEETELDSLGMLGEEREVRPVPIPGRAERKRLSGPGAHRRSSTVFASRSTTSVAGPRRSVSRRPSAVTSSSRGSRRRSSSSSP